jgi:hypothetical protein
MTLSVVTSFEGRISELDPLRIETIALATGSAQDRQKAVFLAEAIFFRLFREYERFISSLFMKFACEWPTPSGLPVASMLRTDEEAVAFKIIKSDKAFLDWSRPDVIRERASVFLTQDNPISLLLSQFNGDLVNFYRIRNFIAHDSEEALRNFEKVLAALLPTPPITSVSAGGFLLMRGGSQNLYFLEFFFRRMRDICSACKSL